MAALLVVSTANARYRAAAGEAVDFDYFVLSLSLAPSFCALSPANQAKEQCATLTTAAFEATPLMVHGLWPNLAGVSSNDQPQDCPGPPFEGLSPAIEQELRRYMAGGPGLARYEWRKHGVCSGLLSTTYFAALATLAQHANEKIGAVMREHGMLGHQVRINDLLAAVAVSDADLASAIIVSCQTPRGGAAPLIDELRIVLSKDLEPMPAISVGLQQNSGCHDGEGMIPEAAK
jgi:ribonuclease T2